MSRGPGEAAGSAATDAGSSPPDDPPPTGQANPTRRIAFRTLAVLTSLWVLARLAFDLLEAGLMWLPYETLEPILEGYFDSEAEFETHRSHLMSIGIVSWALVSAVVTQVRRPHRREAQMAWAVVIIVGGAVVFGLSVTPRQWLLQSGTLLLPIVVLAILHPRARNLYRLPTHDRYMLGLAGLAAVPWLVFAVTQAQHQWRNLAGDSHAESQHWAAVALMALTIAAAAVIGSSDRPGWRLPAWFAAIATIIWAVHSLVFPAATSAATTSWAIAAIVWGIAFAATTLQRQRRQATTTAASSDATTPPPRPPQDAGA